MVSFPAAGTSNGYRILPKQPVDAPVLKDISQWITSVVRSWTGLQTAADG